MGGGNVILPYSLLTKEGDRLGEKEGKALRDKQRMILGGQGGKR
jgi:hypothetical protein